MEIQWQILLILLFVLLELTVTTIAVFNPSSPAKHILKLSSSKQELYSTCSVKTTMIFIWWTFNACVVLMCTYQALLSRKIPVNYNESKGIALAMMTISVELSFCIPSYFYTTGLYPSLILSFAEFLAASVTMVCIFAPKIYITIFRAEQNKPDMPFGSLGTFDPPNEIREKDYEAPVPTAKEFKAIDKSFTGSKDTLYSMVAELTSPVQRRKSIIKDGS